MAEAHACEIAPAHVERLRQMGFYVLDDHLLNLAPHIQYDVICMRAVLGHLPNAPKLLACLRDWLTPEGNLFLITP